MVRPLFWKAKYTDGTFLDQYEKDKENLFKDIEHDKLKGFCVTFEGREFAADLETGRLYVDGHWMGFDDFSDKKDYRLIYFVRTQRHMSSLATGMTQLGVTRFPCIGLRTRIDSAEVKKLIKIFPDRDEFQFISK